MTPLQVMRDDLENKYVTKAGLSQEVKYLKKRLLIIDELIAATQDVVDAKKRFSALARKMGKLSNDATAGVDNWLAEDISGGIDEDFDVEGPSDVTMMREYKKAICQWIAAYEKAFG